MKIILGMAALLLLVAGCESNGSSANVAARRYHDCVSAWTTPRQWHRTFNKDVHEACQHVAGVHRHRHEKVISPPGDTALDGARE